MSRPPKLTKLKPEDNQPPLEAYVLDLIVTPTPTPTIPATNTTEEHQTVMPANTDKHRIATGLTTTLVKELGPVQCQKPKEDTKRRCRHRSMGEPGEVSAAKKQTNNKRVITKPKAKGETVIRLKHKKAQGQAEFSTITTKSGRKSASSDLKGVTKTLVGVTKEAKEASYQNDMPDKPPGESESLTGVTTSGDNALAGVTATLSGVTITNKAEPTTSLSGVTSSKSSKVWPNMTTNKPTTQDGENSMLLAIARLETKLLENHETALNNMEEHLTASMKSIVDNSIKDALKTLTGSINKVVAEDPEIKKHKHNISQLQTQNLRLT